MRTSLQPSHAIAALALAAACFLPACSGSTPSVGTQGASGESGTSSAGASGSSSGSGNTSGTASAGSSSGSGASAGASSGTGSSGTGSGANGSGSASGASAGASASSSGASGNASGSSSGASATGSASGTTASGSGSGSGGGASGAVVDAGPPATFTEVYAIITAHCGDCHKGDDSGIKYGGLNMSTMSLAYTNLVGVKAAGTEPPGSAAGYVACGTTMETRVVPDSSATSLLYNKVNGTQDCGVRMPKGDPALSAANIATIKDWIDQGALNN
jgi:hypothetical protein